MSRVSKLVFIYLCLYFLLINLVTIHRFWQFEAYYFDHGIYESALWNIAHGKMPLIDHLEDKPMNQLGDHFTLSLLLLTPVYWFTSSYLPVLIVQNLFVVLSAWVLFVIARDKVKNNLMSICLTVAFTLFIGLQNAIISNLHPDFLALFSLSLTLYALEKNSWKLYWISLITTLAAKESFVGIGLGIGIYLILHKKRKIGIITVIFSLIYYLSVVKFAMPFLVGGPYGYGYNTYGLIAGIQQLFIPWIKTKTIFMSLANFGLLPIAGLSFLPTVLQDYVIRFVMTNTPARTDLGLHYNTTVSRLLFYGSIVGITILRKVTTWYKRFINLHALSILVLALGFHYFLHGPLGLGLNPAFYRHTADLDFLRSFISKIPPNTFVMTQNNLASQLTHSNEIMLLREDYWHYLPKMIAVDIRPGQNPNNYWPLTTEAFVQIVSRLKIDPNYDVERVAEEQLIFRERNTLNMKWYNQFSR